MRDVVQYDDEGHSGLILLGRLIGLIDSKKKRRMSSIDTSAACKKGSIILPLLVEIERLQTQGKGMQTLQEKSS